MATCLSESEVEQLLAGAESAGGRERLRDHLDTCVHCRLRVAAASARLAAASSHSSVDTTTAVDGSAGDPFRSTLPVIEGYEMISRIHSGAQGVVYKGLQKSTGRTVAIKVLPHEHAATDRQKHRFEREVGLAASLQHPNIVTVFDSGLTAGRYFFAMEYIHGQPLDQYLASNALSVQEKLRMFVTICSAVGYAHHRGVIHRDLKPGNILVDASGQPHVVDFGLAKSAGTMGVHGTAPHTMTSQFLGTPAYAAPEQTRGDPSLIDQRSDVYALGVILFEMLTGQYPYPVSQDLVTMFHSICHVPPRKPSSIVPAVDADVDTILLRALAKDPARRYQTVAEFQDDLERRLAGQPIKARRDSLSYMIRLRGKQLILRRRLTTLTAVVIAAAFIGATVSNAVLARWPKPLNAFEYLATHYLAPFASPAEFEHVRLIAIDDQTVAALDDLVRREGFSDVTADHWPSMRRMHGRLMQRLARSGVKAVVWDIGFVGEQPFNEDFIAGIKALQEQNINPVIAVDSWDISDVRPPQMATSILSQRVHWGVATLYPTELGTWRTDLIVQRNTFMQLLGLDLVAIGAMKHPMMDVVAQLNIDAQTIELRYFPSNASMLQSSSSATADVVNLSSISILREVTVNDIDAGLKVNDVVGQYIFQFPRPEAMERATISYRDVMLADDAQLQLWFGGKLALIGDTRSEKGDWHETLIGEVICGPHGHAGAIESLLQNTVTIRYAGDALYAGFTLVGTTFGLFAARMPRRRPTAAALWLLVAVVLLCLMSVAIYRWGGLMVFPLAPAIGVFVAFAGVIMADRIFRTEAAPELSWRSQT